MRKITDEDKRKEINDWISYFSELYLDKPVANTNQVMRDNPAFPAKTINKYAQDLYGISLAQLFIDEGIVGEKKNDKDSTAKDNYSLEKDLVTLIDELKRRYALFPAYSIVQIEQDNQDLPVYLLNQLIMEMYDKSAKDYLIEANILCTKLRKVCDYEEFAQSGIDDVNVFERICPRRCSDDGGVLRKIPKLFCYKDSCGDISYTEGYYCNNCYSMFIGKHDLEYAVKKTGQVKFIVNREKLKEIKQPVIV